MIMMSSRPSFFSAALSSGTAVRCAAASDDTPRMCTSFSTAWRAASSAVANSGPISTSKPTSAKAEAITFWPRSWPAAFRVFERIDQRLHLFDPVGHGGSLAFIDAGDGFDLGAMAAEHFFQRIGNFPDGSLGARRIDRKRQQIAVALRGRSRERGEGLIDSGLIAFAPQTLQLVDL